MRIAVLKILIVVSAAVLSGCSAGSTGLPTVGSITPNAASGPAPLGSGMQLQAGDKVRVTVFGEDKISGEYEIDLDGFLSLPLAGTMKAAGQNKMELEGIIATKLKSNYLKDPKVTVDVVTFRPIYVLGEVQKPGEYPYRSGLNVMSALAVAGGSTYRASNSRVMIQRFGEPALKEYALDPSVAILPGDVIRLPERYF